MKGIIGRGLSVCILAWASTARAADLFSLTATPTAGTPITENSSNIIDLVKDVVGDEGQFTSLGNSFSSSLNYAGIRNAFTFSETVDGGGNTVLTMQSPLANLNQTFSSATGSLTTQVINYLKKDGLADLTAFQAAVDKETPVGVVDGNPLSLTDLILGASFLQFGQNRSADQINSAQPDNAKGRGDSWFWFDGGGVDAGGFNGTYVDFHIGSAYHFNNVIALAADAPFEWERIEGSNVFMGGLIVGLPITVIPSHGNNSISWMLTPAAHGGAVGSEDLVSGAIIYGGQFSSSLSYAFGGMTITLADTIGYFHGANIAVSGYDFDTRLDQVLSRNGLTVTQSWGHVFVDAAGSWTNALRATYVDGYVTPEAGAGIWFGQHHGSGMSINYIGNYGRGYNTTGGQLLFFFRD